MSRTSHALVVIAAAGLLVAACTTKNTDRPALAGPSELALSLSLSASPDILTQDGSAQSRIVILARDQNGAAVKGLPLHLSALLPVTQNGTTSYVTFGSLSTADVTTGSDGRATVTYTPPAATSTTDTGTTVSVTATPVGTDYGNEIPRSVQIRLVPPGYVAAAPVASFTYSPISPVPNAAVSFDGSASKCDTATITDYDWDFGDNQTGTGKTAQHTFRTAGDYTVKLQVWDDKGRASQIVSQTVTVAAPLQPTANFVTSPQSPAPNQTVYLNASTSTPGTGRTLVKYAWDFGNGTTGLGATTTVSYSAIGTYTIVLVVTDDIGQTSTTSKAVTVANATAALPTAGFVYSPAAPTAGQDISFDGSISTVATGHTIASYVWTFGDGTSPGTGRTYTKTGGYAAAGTYTVELTVTDDIGQKASKSLSVTVTGTTAAAPVASFTVSPTNPTANMQIVFDASASTGSTGQTIASYAWNFGDATQVYTTTNRTAVHSYAYNLTFTITLTVTDTAGKQASTTKTLSVAAAQTLIANFTFSPSPAVPYQTITFDASSSTIVAGHAVRYEWTWGDSATIESTTSATRTHSYSSAGTYNVTMTLTDTVTGVTSTITRAVVVQNP